MPITIGAKRESDFTDPIGMLGDCHRRIERFLNVQVTLATREKGGPSPKSTGQPWRPACATSAKPPQSTPRMRKRACSRASAESTLPKRKPYWRESIPWNRITNAPGRPTMRWTDWDNVGSPVAGFPPKTHPGSPPCSTSWQSCIAITSPLKTPKSSPSPRAFFLPPTVRPWASKWRPDAVRERPPQRSNRGDPALHRAHRGSQALLLFRGEPVLGQP